MTWYDMVSVLPSECNGPYSVANQTKEHKYMYQGCVFKEDIGQQEVWRSLRKEYLSQNSKVYVYFGILSTGMMEFMEFTWRKVSEIMWRKQE